MLEYAKDATKTDKPWELWEFRSSHVPTWTTLGDNPSWFVNVEYRRKPRQVTLSVPKAETNPPECLTVYYCPNIESMVVDRMAWTDHNFDKKILKSGILYLNEADAQQAVNALKTLFKGE